MGLKGFERVRRVSKGLEGVGTGSKRFGGV